MVSNILSVGNKIELSKKIVSKDNDEEGKKRVFVSQVLDIVDEDVLRIAMPIEQGKVIPIPVNARLDACFYTSNGLYQGKIQVTDRYKEGQIFILVVELVSSLSKYQRRQYFRLGCVIDVHYKKLSEDEIDEYGPQSDIIIDDYELTDGTALDISGGGLRFVSKERMDCGQYIFVSMEVTYGVESKYYGLVGHVKQSYETRNNDGMYEHRIEFVNMEGTVRESLIKFIFEEERRQRNNGKI